MACSCCGFGDTVEQQFTRDRAAKELHRYRRKGMGTTTRLLRDGLARAGLTDGVLLDIGAGIGALTFELLEGGFSRATVVEASSAYLAAASDEAARRDRAAAIELVRGDFLDVAGEIPTANVVTLDRVICCYPFYERLLTEALRHADHGFAFSYPRDRWYVRAGVRLENALRRRRTAFRTFVHPEARMRQLIECADFALVSHAQTFTWSVDVFVRRPRSTSHRSAQEPRVSMTSSSCNETARICSSTASRSTSS
jgi:SAM-dependent methyltransferase